MKKLKYQDEFEQWLSNTDATIDKHDMLKDKSNKFYFYNKTQNLYHLFVLVKDLKKALATLDEPHCNYLPEFDCTVTELLNRLKDI